jgi:hypothetical protein
LTCVYWYVCTLTLYWLIILWVENRLIVI